MNTDTPKEPAVEQDVSRWLARLDDAEKKFAPAFTRMQANTSFAAGRQWQSEAASGQSENYMANVTLRTVNRKVADLYARNPKAMAQVRKHRYAQVWDESLMTLQSALQNAMLDPFDPEANAIIADYEQVRDTTKMVAAIADTLEKLYSIQLDMQEPEFKLQMKQLVRRVVTCGVGFAWLAITRKEVTMPTSTTQLDSMVPQANLLRARSEQLKRSDVDQDSPEATQMLELTQAVQTQQQVYAPTVEERLIVDFPNVDSIILDPRTQQIRGLVGTRWLARRFRLSVDEINAFYETQLREEDFKVKQTDGPQPQKPATTVDAASALPAEAEIDVFEVWDKTTRTTRTIARGYDGYLKAPAVVYPALRRFWPLCVVAFNDVELVGDFQPSLLYPPSDVELMAPAQREWNRTRNALKLHRTANRPKYACTVPLTDEDKMRIQYADEQAVIDLQGLPPGTDASKVLVALSTVPIDPTLYDTGPLQQDMLMAVGMSSENLGPIQPDGTATQAAISEQSRSTQTASNVDDLDDFLSDMAKIGGELLMLEFSEPTVKALVGEGAVWPSWKDRPVFASEVLLEVKAASAGRPNKALEVANFERMAPLLLQAGAAPMFLVEEGVRRLDDQLDVAKAMPLGGPVPMPMGGGGGQPLQSNPSDVAVPLPGQPKQQNKV